MKDARDNSIQIRTDMNPPPSRPRRLYALTLLLLVALAAFALTRDWRRQLQEKARESRRLVVEAEASRSRQNDLLARQNELDSLLRLDPGNLEARLELAHRRLTVQGAPAALAVLQPVERDTGDTRALRALAECYRLTRREDRALDLLNRAARLAPGDGDVHVDRALMLSSLIWFAQAEEALSKAEALHADPRQTSLVRAMIAWQRSEYAEARRTLESALRQFPEDPPLIRQLAVVANSQGLHDEAARLFQLLADRGDAQALVMVAKVQLQKEDAASVQQAVTAARKALALRPGLVHAQMLLGRALRLSGKADEALRILEDAYRRSPKLRGLAFELFQLYGSRGQRAKADKFLAEHRNGRERFEAMRKAITMVMVNPDQGAAHREMAQACLDLALYGRSIVSSRRALQLGESREAIAKILASAEWNAERAKPVPIDSVDFADHD